jgi:hypothetical protein
LRDPRGAIAHFELPKAGYFDSITRDTCGLNVFEHAVD